ncbi:uncharacterized protein LOC142350021 isoform X2 [Convolutriloba macropyga]|uniref:uncharacterized protein LOC142350021 isoform X2 n=1 Tax=Convolutriloba macropyga TaxID=536237 RepID=UPI003F51FCC9
MLGLKFKLVSYLTFQIVFTCSLPEFTNQLSPQAKIKVKVSDLFIDQVFTQVSELLTNNLQKWRYSLDFETAVTSTSNGSVRISSFSQPTLTVGTSQGSKEVSITATFSQLTLEWTYGLYIHAYLFKKSWGQALLFYHLNDLTMTFTLPGVTLAPVAMPSSSSSQESDKEIGSGSKGAEYALTMDGPVSWRSTDWFLRQWSFDKEYGQGEDFGGKLLEATNQNILLSNLTRTMADCLSGQNSVVLNEVTNFINSSVEGLPKLSANQPLLKVNNDKLAKLSVSELYEYVSLGLYGDNKRSLWFAINLKSSASSMSTLSTSHNRYRRNKLNKRHADDGEGKKVVEQIEDDCSTELPERDLSLDVKRVAYKIDLSDEAAQVQALGTLDSPAVQIDLLNPWKRTVGTLKDPNGNDLKLTDHRLQIGPVVHHRYKIGATEEKTGNGIYRNVTWTFSVIEVDRVLDFFGSLVTHDVNFTITASSLKVNTWSSGTSFFHNYLSKCQVLDTSQQSQIYSQRVCPTCKTEELRQYVSMRLASLGQILADANSNMTIEWKVNLPPQYSYSRLQSDWTVYESVLDVELQTNIL